MARRRLASLACLALIAATPACAGTLNDPDSFLEAVSVDASGEGSVGAMSSDGECTSIPAFFGTTCTASACHSSSNMAQGLDLQSPNLAVRLVGVAATEGKGLLIDPSTPSESILYLKLTASPPFGARMPLGEAPLDDPMMACVLDWINQEVAGSGSEAGATADAGGTDAGSE
jgi:hypothetical protein